MKISLSLLSVGMIAAAATAADRNYDVLDYTGNGLMQQATRISIVLAKKAPTCCTAQALTHTSLALFAPT